MKGKQLVVNAYVIDCAGWFDFDEESRQTTVKIDWGNSESDIITDYLHGIFKCNANQKTGEVIPGDILIAAHCDGAVFVHQPYEMISGANGNAREFIFKDGFVEAMKEDKPKRMKFDLKLANYATVSSAIKAHEDGIKFVRLLPDGDTEDLSWFGLCECYANGYEIRVKVEIEIDERQEFIDSLSTYCKDNGYGVNRRFLVDIFDSKLVQLVEGE